MGINGGYFPAICRVRFCFNLNARQAGQRRLVSGNLLAMFVSVPELAENVT